MTTHVQLQIKVVKMWSPLLYNNVLSEVIELECQNISR